MKGLILGHAQHAKDTFAEMLGMSYSSSSEKALDLFLFESLNQNRTIEGIEPYNSKKEAYDDRFNNRATWYSEICVFNEHDKARLAKEILRDSDIYVGMRSNEEYQECIKQDIFDFIIWIDASKRKPLEPKSSMSIEFDKEKMIYIDNNSGLSELKDQAENLIKFLDLEHGYE